MSLTAIDTPGGDLAHYLGPPTTSSTVSYQYFNAHGDLAAEATSTGTRTATYTYDPFGAPNDTAPANTTTERWTGAFDKKLDTTTGLIAMGARGYDPALGRFLSVDPIDGGSLNGYDYAGQDPVNNYDLDGEMFAADQGGGGRHVIDGGGCGGFGYQDCRGTEGDAQEPVDKTLDRATAVVKQDGKIVLKDVGLGASSGCVYGAVLFSDLGWRGVVGGCASLGLTGAGIGFVDGVTEVIERHTEPTKHHKRKSRTP